MLVDGKCFLTHTVYIYNYIYIYIYIYGDGVLGIDGCKW